MNTADKKGDSLAGQTILLMGAGTAVPVISETVWALAHEEPPVMPHRVVVITTTFGRDNILQAFFNDDKQWENLRSVLIGKLQDTVPDVAGRVLFDRDRDLLVPTAPNQAGAEEPLQDIRSTVQTHVMGDFILRVLRDIISRGAERVITSVAGGRKTMGASLASALTVCGRLQDRLTHVLVSDGLDEGIWRPRFLFPDPQIGCYEQLKDRSADAVVVKTVERDQIKLELVDAPFPRLGEVLTTEGDDVRSLEASVDALMKRLRLLEAQAEQVTLADPSSPSDDTREALRRTSVKRTPLLGYFSRHPDWKREQPFRGTRVLIVLHYLSNLVSFVDGLLGLGMQPEMTVALYKDYPYPQKRRIEDWLRAKGVRVGPNTVSERKVVLDEIENAHGNEPIVVIEDGCYWTMDLLARPALAARVRGVVEQTTRGQRKIEKWCSDNPGKKEPFPVLLLPESHTKRDFEPDHVSGAIVKSIDAMIPDFLARMEVTVFGFGTIGERVADILAQFHARVTVCSPDAPARAHTQNKGFKFVQSPVEAVKGADLVIGTAGCLTIDCDVIAALKHNTYLASASSEQVEIDLECLDRLDAEPKPFLHDFLEKAGGEPLPIGTIYTLPPDDRKIILLADGMPVNFTGFSGMKDQAADLIMTLLFVAGVRMAARDYDGRSGIVPDAINKLETEFNIAREFNRLQS
ncbi:MAG: CRISPR-associated ring nuclease Csm6 [Prosthecobacter sp.]|uniref:CRISPR-associated ring nuclease Csm6 n=1 Tax=Prosthecobacter sp. TaxID=1965333 RepID=UPI0038FD7C31